MKIPKKNEVIKKSFLRRASKISMYFLLLSALALVLFVRASWSERSAEALLRKKYPSLMSRYRPDETDYSTVLVKTLIESAYQNIVGVFEGSHLEKLNLNIPFEDLERVKRTREKLLNDTATYLDLDGYYFNGRVQFRDKNIPARFRLKGGRKDHIEDDKKWSYRVKLKKGKRLKGMKNFSLQSAHTRGFQLEPLYLKMAKDLGLVAVRYDFVDASVNGEPIGVMAIEEHFAKQLLESNERRESVILKLFSEDHREAYFAMRKHSLYPKALEYVRDKRLSPIYRNLNLHLEGPFGGIGTMFFNAKSIPIEVFESGRVSRTETLTQLNKLGVGIMRGLIEGSIRVEDAIDTEKYGAYFALQWLWRTHHPASWTNQRFYFNPVTLKIEPIVFDTDARGGKEFAEVPFNPNQYDSHISRIIFSSPQTQIAFKKYAKLLYRNMFDGAYIKELREHETYILSQLRTEYNTLPRVNFESIKRHLAKTIGDIQNDKYFKHYREWKVPLQLPADLVLPRIMFAYHYPSGEGTTRVELSNILDMEVVVDKVAILNVLTGGQRAVEVAELPLVLPPTDRNRAPSNIMFTIPEMGKDEVLVGRAKPKLQTIEYEFQSQGYFPAYSRHPLASDSLESILEKYPFLQFDESSHTLTVPAGNWVIANYLIIPTGIGLRLEAGAQLKFTPNAGLMLQGRFEAKGSENRPIVLQAAKEGEYWKGVSVLQTKKTSTLENVEIRDITFAEHNGWKTTGGITFYEADVNLKSVSIQNATSEDAINIVRSKFSMLEVEISDATSDAFDGDFVQGRVEKSRFSRILGDGVDTSGSQIEVIHSDFVEIGDKAVSSGEASSMRVSNISVNGSRYGVASKDGSTTFVKDSFFENVDTVLATYQKKTEYDGATLQAQNLKYTSNENSLIAQKGNQLILDGVRLPEQKVDVDALYKE